MADVLIRDVPDEVVSALEQRAARLGLSRAEFLRRTLQQEVGRSEVELELADLLGFQRRFSDLADESVMDNAWR